MQIYANIVWPCIYKGRVGKNMHVSHDDVSAKTDRGYECDGNNDKNDEKNDE